VEYYKWLNIAAMKYKFYVKEIPLEYNIWNYILKNTDIESHYSMRSVIDSSDIITLKHDFDISSISSSVKEMQENFGFKPWLSENGDGLAYGGLSLVYNPDLIEEVDLNQQTLGTRTNKMGEFFWAQNQKFKSTRNTYFDSYGFRKLSPCVTETSFKEFVCSFKRPIIRSRIGTINSKYVPEKFQSKFGWHKDEVLFENLRINIPISTDPSFMMQVEGKTAQHLPVGNMYTWDTNIPHRAFPTSCEDRTRTHIVLGLSPWFDYDPEEDSFTSNEFYGEMHPLDMLANGHIHEKITGTL
jgi:hypothetical protein